MSLSRYEMKVDWDSKAVDKSGFSRPDSESCLEKLRQKAAGPFRREFTDAYRILA